MQATDSLNLLVYEEHITREEIEAKLKDTLTDDEWLYIANHISEAIPEVGTNRASSVDRLSYSLHWYRTN
jgi:hypothetical protein